MAFLVAVGILLALAEGTGAPLTRHIDTGVGGPWLLGDCWAAEVTLPGASGTPGLAAALGTVGACIAAILGAVTALALATTG